MNELLAQLHDIDGLDPISWWPLATGWWLIIAAATAAAGLLIGYIVYRIAFKRSWKNDTLLKLAALEKKLSAATARETAVILSEYLRRIALRRFARKDCAALMGEAWLAWLSTHDPKQFDWKSKGKLLTTIPYAPENASIPQEQVRDLIHAVKNWVR
jgi:hypothetical protein